MSLSILLNPFTRIAGVKALLLGGFLMLLTAAIAAPCGVNFVGALNIHVNRPTPFWIIFGLIILGWLTASFCFFVAGKILSKSSIRAIDIFGTLALARAPQLVAAPFGLLPGLWSLDPKIIEQPDSIPAPVLTSIIVVSLVFLAVDIAVVILSYNAFAVSANVKNKGVFAVVLILSELVAMLLSSLAISFVQQSLADRLEKQRGRE